MESGEGAVGEAHGIVVILGLWMGEGVVMRLANGLDGEVLKVLVQSQRQDAASWRCCPVVGGRSPLPGDSLFQKFSISRNALEASLGALPTVSPRAGNWLWGSS